MTLDKAVGIAVADGRSADGTTGGREATCSATTLPNSEQHCAHTVSIGANVPATLTVANGEDEENTDLVNTADSSAVIPAQDGTAVVHGTAGWNITGGSLANKAITTSAQTVDSLAAAGEKDVNMTYNFATNPDQKAGTYQDVITYTITAN